MGILNKTKCYTIGHMQYINGRGWRERVKKELNELGVTVFSPYEKPFISLIPEDENARANLLEQMEKEEYDSITNHMKMVRNQDLRLCDLSDFLIAHINPSVASWGSAEELVTCCRMKKVVFLSIEGGKKKCPLWLMAMFKHKYIYNNLDEVLEMIKKIDSGEKPIDAEEWKLLLPSYR